MSTSTCPHCGATLFGNVSRCYKCGKDVDVAEKAREDRETLKSEEITAEVQDGQLTWPVIVIFLQGLFELTGLAAFLTGFFIDLGWLTVTGGILVLLDDLIDMGMGVLNPVFPVLLAVVLAIIFTPWYVGVFWASAAFKVFNIPISLKKVFAPEKFLANVNALVV